MTLTAEEAKLVRDALAFALDHIADGADYEEGEIPTHYCEYQHNPESGSCEFHDSFFELVQALAILDAKGE